VLKFLIIAMIFYQLHLAPTSDDISLRVRIQRNGCMGLHGERLTRERLTNTIIKITKNEKNTKTTTAIIITTNGEI